MNINILAGLIEADPFIVASALGIFGVFGWGKAPTLDTVLDAERVASTLRQGIGDLCDADRRRDGWSRVDPAIALDDVILAARMAHALDKSQQKRR